MAEKTKRKTTTRRKTTPKKSTEPQPNASSNSSITRKNSDLATADFTKELGLVDFDPSQTMPTDLFSDSSSLARTSESDANGMVQAIQEKRQTIRVVSANLDLQSDIIAAATKWQKNIGRGIEYATARVDNQAKEAKFQEAGVRLDIANLSLQTAQEMREQAQIKAEATEAITGMTRDEWENRKKLKQAKVNELKIQIESVGLTLQEKADKALEGGVDLSGIF